MFLLHGGVVSPEVGDVGVGDAVAAALESVQVERDVVHDLVEAVAPSRLALRPRIKLVQRALGRAPLAVAARCWRVVARLSCSKLCTRAFRAVTTRRVFPCAGAACVTSGMPVSRCSASSEASKSSTRPTKSRGCERIWRTRRRSAASPPVSPFALSFLVQEETSAPTCAWASGEWSPQREVGASGSVRGSCAPSQKVWASSTWPVSWRGRTISRSRRLSLKAAHSLRWWPAMSCENWWL